jgi:hypothetical protein
MGRFHEHVIEDNIAPAELPTAFAVYLTELPQGEWNGEVEEIGPANQTDE